MWLISTICASFQFKEKPILYLYPATMGWISKLSPFLRPPWADDRILDGFGIVGNMVLWRQRMAVFGQSIVSKMVLASAAGTGPIFPGAPAPPDVNVANPTRPGIRLPCSVNPKWKKKQIPPWCPGTRPGTRLDQPSTATPKFEGKCRLILARYMAWTN